MSGSISCSCCGESFDTVSAKNVHKGMVHGWPDKTCQFCGSKFEVPPNRDSTAKYCCEECQFKSLEVERVEYSCDFCDSKLSIRPKEMESWDKHFCDIHCRKQYFTKENHPKWNGGYAKLQGAKYGPEWESWREKIISRDVVCQKCGENPETKTVHHIKPVREFLSEGKEINDSHSYSNLVLLCQSCHGEVENYGIEEQKDILL